MNILLFGLDYKPNPGGVAEYSHQLVDQLHKLEHNVLVVSKPIAGHEVFDANVHYPIHRIPYPVLQGRRSSKIWTLLRRSWVCYRRLRELAKRHSVDWVLCNALGSEAHICRLVAQRVGARYGIFAYGLEINKRREQLFGRLQQTIQLHLGMRPATRVFPISSFTHERLMQLGLPEDRMTIVAPGYSPTRGDNNRQDDASEGYEEQWEATADRPVLLTVGRLVKRKGVDVTLKAIKNIRKEIPNVLYIVAGEGPCRSRLEAMAQEYGIEENVEFLGHVNEEEKCKIYQQADVFVMPNRELENGDVEGFGIVFLEANAYGKPVIGGRSGGAVDAIADGYSGLLVDPTDDEELAASILKLLTDEKLAKRLGEQGRQRVANEFGWDKTAAKLQSALHQTAEAGSRS